MPHTSHRKKKQNVAKRVEVTDENGWTRVTTTNHKQQTPRQADSSAGPIDAGTWKTTPETGATADKVQEEYTQIEARWRDSEACKALTTLFEQRVLADGRRIDKCVMFGSGSFCGLREGWISMKTAAMSQLAAYSSMHGTIEQVTGAVVPMYAQDPAYNDIDIEFLKLLGIEVVLHPRGFETLTSKSLAYTPTAELHVELQTLAARPGVRLGSKLDFYWRNEKGLACTNRVRSREIETAKTADDTPADGEQQAQTTGIFQTVEEECCYFETFIQGREEASVPRFDIKDVSPFRDQHLYWLKSLEDGEVENEVRLDLVEAGRQD